MRLARIILSVGAGTWLLAGAAGIVTGIVGAEELVARLPTLAIDADAVGGALTATGTGMAALGCIHVAVLVGLRRGRRWAASGGALLGAVMAPGSLALAATAGASASRESVLAAVLLAAAAVGTLAAIGYVVMAVRMVRALGSRAAN